MLEVNSAFKSFRYKATVANIRIELSLVSNIHIRRVKFKDIFGQVQHLVGNTRAAYPSCLLFLLCLCETTLGFLTRNFSVDRY